MSTNPNNRKRISIKTWMLKWIIGSNALILLATFSVFIFSIVTDFNRKRDSIQENLDIATKTFYVSIMKKDRLTLEMLFNSIAVNYKSDSFALCEKNSIMLSSGSSISQICSDKKKPLTKFESLFSQDPNYKLVLKINKSEFFRPVIELFGVLFLAFIFIFLIIKIAIQKINNDIISPLLNNDLEVIEIDEISTIMIKIRKSYQDLLENSRAQIKFDLSKKIAHDIRSPISTLNLISQHIQDPELSNLQKMVVDQINTIANELLVKSNKIGEHYLNNLNNCESQEEIFDFFKRIQFEFEFKKSAFTQSINFQIEKDTNRSIYLSREQQGVLYSNINNFIQNSIEATNSDGLIEVILRSSNRPNKTYEIVVKDNGKGIPDHILQKLGNEVVSYGKDNNNIFNSGNGIALFNAKKDLKNINADLEIKSVINVGTEVIIYI